MAADEANADILDLPSSGRARRWLRVLLAGPVVLAAACFAVVGGALSLPAGSAGVNNLVLPVVLFPLLWAVLFLYACLDRRLARAWLVVGALLGINVLIFAWHWTGAS